MTTRSYWAGWPGPPRFDRLTKTVKADVAVVGGVTGVTAAYLLENAGFSVALLEREGNGSGDTGQTTAHLTGVTDPRLSRLVRDFGRNHAGNVRARPRRWTR